MFFDALKLSMGSPQQDAVLDDAWNKLMEKHQHDEKVCWRVVMFGVQWSEDVDVMSALIDRRFGAPLSDPREYDFLEDLSSSISSFYSNNPHVYRAAIEVLLTRQFSFGLSLPASDLSFSQGLLWSKSLGCYAPVEAVHLAEFIQKSNDDTRTQIQAHMESGVIPTNVVLSAMITVVSSQNKDLSEMFFKTLPSSVCSKIDQDFSDLLDQFLMKYLEGDLIREPLQRFSREFFALTHLAPKFQSTLLRALEIQMDDLDLLSSRIEELLLLGDQKEKSRMTMIARSAIDCCVHLLKNLTHQPATKEIAPLLKASAKVGMLEREPILLALHDKMMLEEQVATDGLSANRSRKI